VLKSSFLHKNLCNAHFFSKKCSFFEHDYVTFNSFQVETKKSFSTIFPRIYGGLKGYFAEIVNFGFGGLLSFSMFGAWFNNGPEIKFFVHLFIYHHV